MAQIDPRTGLPFRQGTPQPQNVLGSWTPSGNSAVNYTGAGGSTPSPFLNVPGFTPDYKSLIENDAIFSQDRANLAAQGISDAAARAAATQRAVGQFGIVPSLDQLGGLNRDFLNADITPQTRALAQTNTDAGLSIAARQKRQFDQNVRAIKNSLAARGALRSGEAGHQLQEAQRGFDTARFDTTQELLEYLSGVQRGFVEGERARLAQVSQGAAQATERQVALNPAQPDRQARWNGSGYVYADGTPVPRNLWPDNGSQAAPAAGGYASAPYTPTMEDFLKALASGETLPGRS